MGLKTIDIVAALVLNLLQYAYSDHILSCNASILHSCRGENQICSQKTSQCNCLPGYIMVDEDCEAPDSDTSSGHATAAVVTIFALALIICGLVLVVRKYNLVEYLCQKLRKRNDVMYEDVMIGNDDPPLSP